MNINEAGKISELAKSLYDHRLAASMEDAVEMAQKMIGSENPGESKGVEHITPIEVSRDELESDVEALKITGEGADDAFKKLKVEVKELHEELGENLKEFEEIKHYIKDIEAIADNEEVVKKEEAGIKTAEMAEKPPTEIDDKLDLE